MREVLISAAFLLQMYEENRIKALAFAQAAPDEQSRQRALGAAETFEALGEGLQQRIAKAQAEAGDGVKQGSGTN